MGALGILNGTRNPIGDRRSQEMELVVDTGATYPVVPASVAEHLGIRPSEELTLTLANGTRLPRKVGWAGSLTTGVRPRPGSSSARPRTSRSSARSPSRAWAPKSTPSRGPCGPRHSICSEGPFVRLPAEVEARHPAHLNSRVRPVNHTVLCLEEGV